MLTNFLTALAALGARLRRVLDAHGLGCSWGEAFRVSAMPAIAGGAQTITNIGYADRPASWIPACHSELADQTLVGGTLTTTTVNTGIAGLKWIRVRGIIKTLGGFSAAETMRISVQAGTGAAITSPTQIAQIILTMETGDTALTFEMVGWSNAGFQSYAIIITCSDGAGISVLDIITDCA